METTIGLRLREERRRLRVTQQQTASLVGISIQALKAWVHGTKIPAQALAILATRGFDVPYIVLGQRSVSTVSVACHKVVTLSDRTGRRQVTVFLNGILANDLTVPIIDGLALDRPPVPDPLNIDPLIDALTAAIRRGDLTIQLADYAPFPPGLGA